MRHYLASEVTKETLEKQACPFTLDESVAEEFSLAFKNGFQPNPTPKSQAKPAAKTSESQRQKKRPPSTDQPHVRLLSHKRIISGQAIRQAGTNGRTAPGSLLAFRVPQLGSPQAPGILPAPHGGHPNARGMRETILVSELAALSIK